MQALQACCGNKFARENKTLVMNRIYWLVFPLVFMAFQLQASPHYKKHTVLKGETLFSISRSYGLKVADLVKVNPDIKTNKTLRLGQQLNIPGVNHIVAEVPIKTVRKDTLAHKAKLAGVPSTPDTPYREEENQVRSTADDKTALSTTATDNSQLALPARMDRSDGPKPEKNVSGNIAATPEVKAENVPVTPFSIRTSSANPGEYASLFGQYSAHNYTVKRNRGAANYLADNSPGNPYLALYSGAETGSVIKVTNMMNNKSVFVKVVGKVPSSDASKEIILKLNRKVAQELGAIDEKFLVEVAGVPSHQ